MTIRLVSELTNVDSHHSDYFVLTASDFLIAPKHKFTAADFDRLEAEVSWGQLTTDDDMRAVTVRDLKRGTTRRLTIRELTPASLIDESFCEGDELWPWLIRFRVVVLDRDGTTLVTSSVVLELEPRVRAASKESPNPSLQRTPPGRSPGRCR